MTQPEKHLSPVRWSFVGAALPLVIFTAACSQQKIGELVNGKRRAPQIVNTIESQDANLTQMRVFLDLSPNGVTVRTYNVPSGSDLFCQLDSHEPAPCQHGDRFDRPAPGEHMMTVTARRAGKIIDSAAARFSILPGNQEDETVASGDHSNPLVITVANPGFKNGDAVSVSRSFTVNFAFPQVPPCEKPVLRCSLDSSTGPWSLCDLREYRKVIPAALMASGSQTLHAQASCGDLNGPITRVHWYGVPDGYKPLMARSDVDESGDYLFTLVREPDCAANSVTWECHVASSSSDWETCASGGRLDPRSAARYDSFRAICNGQRGPLAKYN